MHGPRAHASQIGQPQTTHKKSRRLRRKKRRRAEKKQAEQQIISISDKVCLKDLLLAVAFQQWRHSNRVEYIHSFHSINFIIYSKELPFPLPLSSASNCRLPISCRSSAERPSRRPRHPAPARAISPGEPGPANVHELWLRRRREVLSQLTNHFIDTI